LYAVGETASTGVHGANRLASNSLLECFVFGVRVSEQLSVNSEQLPVNDEPLSASSEYPEANGFQSSELVSNIHFSLRSLVWQAAGICRQKAEMERALAQIQAWQQELTSLKSYDRLWVETSNMADFAYLLVRSALFRTESRGAHYRLDYPDPDPDWQRHTVIQGQEISRQPLEVTKV
jgi:L-aspartate oxidase